MKLSKTHQNLIYQALGQGLGKIITLIYYLILPRILGINSYGKFSFFYSLCMLLIQPVIDLGLDFILIKSIVQKDSGVVTDILALKSLTSVIIGLIIIVLTLKFGWSFSIILGLYFYIVITSFQKTCFAYQRGQENMFLESMFTPIEKSLYIILIWIFYDYRINKDLIIPYSLLIATIITTFSTMYFCRVWFIDALYRPLIKSNLIIVFKEGMYLAGVSFLGLIYFKIDSIMLGFISGFNELATYNAAFRLLEGFIFFPSILMTVYFPKLVKSKQEFSRYFYQLLKWLTVMGLILSLSVFGLSELIIQIVYGEEWKASIPILRCLSFSLFPICIGHIVTQSLVAQNFQKQYFVMVCLTTLENILLNLIFIPRFQALGSGIATFLTELSITSLSLYWLYSRRAISPYMKKK